MGQVGQSAASLLRQMLSAGFPAEHALRSLNSLLALRGGAAAVTVDLVELRLDSGRASVYKWGAAPSLLLFDGMAEKIVFTGKIDEFFGYKFGKLEYRTVRFETETLDMQNFQGNAVVNYTSHNEPFTRIIEHKHFEPENQNYSKPITVISREYSTEWKEGMEPFYPVNDEKNAILYSKYKELANKEKRVIFGGRLAEYKYYDMDDVIEKVMKDAKDYL